MPLAGSTHSRGRKGGKPKGYKAPQTLDKLQAREYVRQRVIAELGPLLEAQFSTAKGLKYLVARNKNTGKFDKLTAEQAEKMLGDEELKHVVIEVWEQAPSVPAFTDLLNRALDKPKEQEQEHKISGDLTITIDKPWS